MKKKSKIIGYIIGLLLFVVMIVGVSYAMYKKTLFNINVAGNSQNLDSCIVYSKGVNISSGSLMPTDKYTGGSSATITFYKNSSCPYDSIYGHIYLDVNSMTSVMSRELRYSVIDNNTSNIVGEGSFYTYFSNSSLLAVANIPLDTTNKTYTIYVWLDADNYDASTANDSFDIDIRCSATIKSISDVPINIKVPNTDTAANFVKYLYDSCPNKTIKTVNNKNYNTAPTVSLMNDRLGGITESLDGGDIRYYGSHPNNYVWLGDTYSSDYSCRTLGSSSYSTQRKLGDKKLWRIIGVFDGRIKLVSNDTIISSLSWDTSESTVNGGGGINQWGKSSYSDTGAEYEGADLMRLLNPGYEEETVNNSLYWNKGTGTVYTGSSNATKTNVSFENTGLSNKEKEMIDDAMWYLGAIDTSLPLYVDNMYLYERQSDILGKSCSSGNYCNDTVIRTAAWEGKVGLIYPSDFGYAADLSSCYCEWYNTVSCPKCEISDWMYTITFRISAISPFADTSNGYATKIFSYRNTDLVNSIYGVFPSIYLKPNVVITSGNGTENNPYVLNLG